jgi:hypothetical protein
MAFPETARLEGPILQELLALGGEERIAFLSDRLVGYFPQLADHDLKIRNKRRESQWKLLVQRAGTQLVKKGELTRGAGHWRLTPKGRERADAERMVVALPSGVAGALQPAISEDKLHQRAQTMLVEIGRLLGKQAEKEYAEHRSRYDVVWKDASSRRLSHIFEIQVKGHVRNALVNLHLACADRRSKPVLVVFNRQDREQAQDLLQSAFHEIRSVTLIVDIRDIERLYHALDANKDVLQEILS